VTASQPLIGIPSATHVDQEYNATPSYRFNGHYPAALAACGALPLVIPLNLPVDTLRAIFERLDGLCLAGGVDVDPAEYGESRHVHLGSVDRARDETELALARWALEVNLPVLGICRGIQLLNVAAGGTLYQHISDQVAGALTHDHKLADSPWERPTHRVVIEPAGLLAGILGVREVMTNSFHHQAIKAIASEFRGVAYAEDGIIEGIEHPERRFALAVQWHPEGMFRSDPYARKIFEAFVAACSETRPAQG